MLSGGEGVLPVCRYADNTAFCLLLSEMRLAFILVNWNLFAVTFYIISYMV